MPQSGANGRPPRPESADERAASGGKPRLVPLERRLLARALDVSALVAIAAVGSVPSLLAIASGAVDDWLAPLTAALPASGVLAVAIYQSYLMATSGQTVGKLLVGIVVVMPDGSLPGFVEGVLLRSWVFVVSSIVLPFIPLVDALVIFGRERRCLHDYLAGTVVIDVEGYAPREVGGRASNRDAMPRQDPATPRGDVAAATSAPGAIETTDATDSCNEPSTPPAAVAPAPQPTADEPGELLNGRYRMLEELGRGGFGTTWLAADQERGSNVAIKQLCLWRQLDWKALELFEREARTLRRLDHPAIPLYVDYFEATHEGAPAFFLVQELADGKSLAAWVDDGWRPRESEVKAIARDLLAVLEYLHDLAPSVVHRDIKPENVIRSSSGRLALIDFGSVRDVAHSTQAHGSTIAGTFGYMAPEQFRGHAVPATDLYGLGATLLHLVTGKSPVELPEKGGRVDVARAARGSPGFKRWLTRMTAAAPEERFPSAAAARRALDWSGLPRVGPAVRIPILLIVGVAVMYFHGDDARKLYEQVMYVDDRAQQVPAPAPQAPASLVEREMAIRTGQIAVAARAHYLDSASSALVLDLGERVSPVYVLPPTSPKVPRRIAQVSHRSYQSQPDDWSGSWQGMSYEVMDRLRAQYQWVRESDNVGAAVAHADLDGDGRADLRMRVVVACRVRSERPWCEFRGPTLDRGDFGK